MFLSSTKCAVGLGLAAILISGAAFADGPSDQEICSVSNAPTDVSYLGFIARVEDPYPPEAPTGDVRCDSTDGTCTTINSQQIQGFAKRGDHTGVRFSGSAEGEKNSSVNYYEALCKNGEPIPAPAQQYILCTIEEGTGLPKWADYGAGTAGGSTGNYSGNEKSWNTVYIGVINANYDNYHGGCQKLYDGTIDPKEIVDGY